MTACALARLASGEIEKQSSCRYNKLMIVLAISVHARDVPVQRQRDGHARTLTFESHQKEQPPQGVSASRIRHSTLKPQSCSQHFIVGHQDRSVASSLGRPHLIPRPIRPDIRAALTARLTHKTVLDIGQPDIVGPFRCGDRNHVAAFEIGAIDQDAGYAGGAHLAECDFDRPGGKHPILNRVDRAQASARGGRLDVKSHLT
jgi:hypothetical protein